LKALALVKDIPFVIIGNGPDEEYLKQMSQELGLDHVRFVGPKWGSELDGYLSKARFVVVPSLWQETFPYVILQAFAACKPVIGTKRGGIPEMIGEDRGLLYEATDEKKLSELIKKMSESETMRKEMGVAARNYIEENFNDEAFYSMLKSNYDRALSL
jgi:glycosyltransferase involved in cell wall biosynthesis